MKDSTPHCLKDGQVRPPVVEELPEPPEVLQAHSLALVERIREAMDEAGGALDFQRYMAMALYEPGLGYYSSGLQKFGAEGDFVTAPEISPFFSRALAQQVADVLAGLGGGEVLEFGAGSGAMAVEMLLALEQLGQLPQRYLILELSADLRDRQRQALEARAGHLLSRVAWLDALPEGFVGVMVGNEVLDAMPVRRFRTTDQGLEQAMVVLRENRLQERWQPADVDMQAAVAHLQTLNHVQLPEGYSSEYNPNLPGWFAGIAESLQRGAVIQVDYGYHGADYYSVHRSRGTLICHYRHRVHEDPYVYPGLQDITANVDFTAVTEAAVKAGLQLAGYTTQAQFLLGCGMASLFEQAVAQADTVQRLKLAQQFKTLTLPDEMGERFKVIAFTKALSLPLRGFALRDFSSLL